VINKTSIKTILILAANPKTTSRLRLDEEIREIDNGLQAAKKREQFRLVQKSAVRQRDFYQAILKYEPQIVHFCGHSTENDGIFLEDELGQSAPVKTKALSQMFKLFADKGVECVVLNACYSEEQAQAISQYIKYVVGMNKAIGDKAAINFAVAFYDALGAGEDVPFAYNLGCAQLVGLQEDSTPVLKQQEKLAPETKEARKKSLEKTIRYFGFFGFGAGGFGTINLVLAGNYQAAFLLVLFLVIAHKFASGFTNRVLDKIEERLEKSEEWLADKIVEAVENFVVGLWWKLTSRFQGKYYKNLVYIYRTYQTQGLKTPGAVTPDLEKVFVTLRVSSKSPALISSRIIQKQNSDGNLRIWDFLAEAKESPVYKRIVVIGAPGSGKTTLLKYLALTYAQQKQRRQHRKAPKLIPVLLYLHKIREKIITENPPNLATIVNDEVQNQESSLNLEPPPQWFEEKQGKCLVMLDGLDEVADEIQRRKVSGWVDAQMRAYPKTFFILTSRPFGYQNAELQNVGIVLGIQNFNLQQMEKFIYNWYLQNEVIKQARKEDPGVRADAQRKANDLIGRIKNYPPLAAMALNPLLLTMIATVHDNRGALPGNRVELYAEICEVLLVRRQEAKGISETLQLKASQKQLVLQVLALELMRKEVRAFKLDQGKEIIEQPLLDVASEEVKPKSFLEHITNVSGLLVEKDVGVYEFAHLSFQEYLAASQVKEINQEQLLIEKIKDSWWYETIRLYAAGSNTTELIRAAMDNPNVKSLTLAYDCLEESKSVSQEVRQQLETMSLESPEPEIAKLAAEVKLARRLNKLLRVDENIQIDQSYITHAEYQLFVDEQLNSPQRFSSGSAKKPVTNISCENALGFCRWLSLKTRSNTLGEAESEEIYYYRLPSAIESENYRAKEYTKLRCWTIGECIATETGIRIVKVKVSQDYGRLVNYLAQKDWQKADNETAAIMLKFANQETEGELDSNSIARIPCQTLINLDQLWLIYSNGCFGLGMQSSIWENIPGNQSQKFERFTKIVGWRDTRNQSLLSHEKITFKLDAPPGHLPCIWCLNIAGNTEKINILTALAQKLIACGIELPQPLFKFDVVTVNIQGKEIQRQQCQARYFTEDLGNTIILNMVAIPAGTFTMGAPKDEKGSEDYQRPQHQVTVQPFFMAKYPITQQQWRAVAALPKINHKLNPEPSNLKGDNLPVEKVSWYDAVEFCSRLSKYTGKKYRLPSEAKWEYACRAGTTTPFHFGETITGELANYRALQTYAEEPKGKQSNRTTAVGQFPANAFGLFDMHGNVWEWCLDDWHDNYEHAPTDGSAWFDDNDNNNLFQKKPRGVLRGGSWGGHPQDCRSASRFDLFRAVRPDNLNLIGFRVVCAVGGPIK